MAYRASSRSIFRVADERREKKKIAPRRVRHLIRKLLGYQRSGRLAVARFPTSSSGINEIVVFSDSICQWWRRRILLDIDLDEARLSHFAIIKNESRFERHYNEYALKRATYIMFIRIWHHFTLRDSGYPTTDIIPSYNLPAYFCAHDV